MSENEDLGGPDERHRRPAGVDDATVEALGKLSEGLEMVERARGRLYDWHQLIGGGGARLGEAVELLRKAGHHRHADLIARELVGRNVLTGRWSFQTVEEFNRVYYRPAVELEERVRQDLIDGREHVYEAEMKERLRTQGHPDHTATP
ncbi:hypothetical protein [Streptomyces specialis]|uniref:hypothetical protein n=1 Tax=Streptomyces specialis TaxID=498367 RepID=UPI00073ECDCD|nr:hypothetical protein [Streptomyces specialis]